MRYRHKYFAFTLGILAALVATSTALPASADGRVDIEQLVPAFGLVQTDEDLRLRHINPEAFDELDASSVRWIGKEASSEYWVARQGSLICLVKHVENGEGAVAMSCSEPTDFDAQGLPIRVSVGNRSAAEAYLLPADIEVSQLGIKAANQGGSHVASNNGRATLVVIDLHDSALVPVEIMREKRAPFSFVPIGEHKRSS